MTDSNGVERNKTVTSLGCFGEHCIASGFVDSKSAPYKTTLVFLTSSDAGYTWSMQPAPLQPVFGHGRIVHNVVQIDAHNAVAVGDTSLVLRSSDAGVTWVQQSCPTVTHLTGVHFVDSSNGIAIGANPPAILTTSDAGVHWLLHACDSNETLASCHCFGPGSYSVFMYGSGPIISTTDNWLTSDTSTPLPFGVPGSSDARVFVGCEYLSADVVVAYGGRLIVSDSVITRQISTVSLTTDRGSTWSNAVDDSGVRTLTSGLHFGDSIIISSQRTGSRVVLSTDRGLTWRTDSMLLPDVGINSINAIAKTSRGTFVGLFGQFLMNGPYLGVGTYKQSAVEAYERIFYGTDCYPNPASSRLRIHSVERSCQCQIADVLGRIVMIVDLDANGDATVDLSHLASGYYSPGLRINGKLIPLRPVVLMHS